MDRERKKKLRTIKLVITEVIMVVSVIVIVIVLTFVAMGYKVNKDGEVDQQGLIQFQSHPTGATVMIDDNAIFPPTNTSKLVSAGEHNITLIKDGYDSWTKKVESVPGRLLKLAYPRLFYQDRTAEKMFEFSDSLTFFVPAPNNDAVIYAKDGSTKWILLDVRGDGAVETEIDLTNLLGGVTVENVVWNEDSNRLLVSGKNNGLQLTTGDLSGLGNSGNLENSGNLSNSGVLRDQTLGSRNGQTEWFVIDVKNPVNSVNLSTKYNSDFSEMAFLNDAGDRLIAIQDGNLRTISLGDQSISQILAQQVASFSYDDGKIIYVTRDNQVKLWQENDDDILVASFDADKKVLVAISGYLNKKYLSFVIDDEFYVYSGDYPNGERELKDMELVMEEELTVAPETLFLAAEDELIVARKDRALAVFDAELNDLHKYNLEGDQMFFVDKYLIGTIADEKLIIVDFDGTNRRELTTATGTAFITKNNKWMYYVRVDNGKTNIFREQIIE